MLMHAKVMFQYAGFVVKLVPLSMTRKRQSFPNKRQLPSHWLEGPFRKVEYLHTLFKVAFQCKWLSSPLYNYVQAHRDNLLPTGWKVRLTLYQSALPPLSMEKNAVTIIFGHYLRSS